MVNTKKIVILSIIETLISIVIGIGIILLFNYFLKLVVRPFSIISTIFSFSTIFTIIICIPIFFIMAINYNYDAQYTELAENLLSYDKVTKVMPIKSNNMSYNYFDTIILPNIANFYAILNNKENCVNIAIIFNDSTQSYIYDKKPKQSFFEYYEILNE